jgi:predicted RNase H-like HicB family nuclease
MNATYRVIIEPDGKAFHGYVPALRGCHTWGKTISETKKHLGEAIEVFLESLVARRQSIPEDMSFESFTTVKIPKRSHRVSVKRYAKTSASHRA